MKSFDFSKVTPNGKLVRLFGSGLVLDISPKGEGLFDIDVIYKDDGSVISSGSASPLPGVSENFMDSLYDEVDRGLYSEV